MSREIIIRIAVVSPELTAGAAEIISNKFGGYFRADGFGGYTFADGRTETEKPSVAFHIGTAAKDSERFEFVSEFAAAYCRAASQESIYFLDVDGAAYLAMADGRINPIGEHAPADHAKKSARPRQTSAEWIQVSCENLIAALESGRTDG